ncbi:amino acid/polyamine transporter I [Mariannaea sp. PMI_226]|nr:amino acid/polyamine transporter I [Mariannaea sp. PMI_226]
MPRQFSLMSMLAFAFSIMNSWTGIISLLVTNLTLGGPACAFWVPITTALVCGIISTGLAELASAFPSAGGQYHFSFMLAPERYRGPAAFVTAWFNIFAYLFTTASAAIFPAQLIAQLASIYNQSYIPERWHIWLIYVAILVFSTAIVILRSSFMPKLQSIYFCASLLAVVTISITLFATGADASRAREVMTTWSNTSGWNTGFAYMLAMGQGMWLYVCVDSATHVSEEIVRPGKYVPIAMVLSVTIGVFSNVIFSLAILFSIKSFEDVQSATLPLYTILDTTIGSFGGVLFLLIWVIFIYIGCVSGLVVTSGRLIWAFSRDNGMPFSSRFDKISEKYKVPVEASVLSCVFCIFYGLIYIGSTVAFNTFISTAILFLNLSYAIPQGLVMITGRSSLPERYFNLGRIFGPFCNIFTVSWVTLYTIVLCAPLTLPVTVVTMNYVCVVLAGGLAFVSALWFFTGKSKTFTGPDVSAEIIDAVYAPNKQKGDDMEP